MALSIRTGIDFHTLMNYPPEILVTYFDVIRVQAERDQ